MAPTTCDKCEKKGFAAECRVYTDAARARYHTTGGWPCSRCRYAGTSCSLSSDAPATPAAPKPRKRSVEELEADNVEELEADNVEELEIESAEELKVEYAGELVVENAALKQRVAELEAVINSIAAVAERYAT